MKITEIRPAYFVGLLVLLVILVSSIMTTSTGSSIYHHASSFLPFSTVPLGLKKENVLPMKPYKTLKFDPPLTPDVKLTIADGEIRNPVVAGNVAPFEIVDYVIAGRFDKLRVLDRNVQLTEKVHSFLRDLEKYNEGDTAGFTHDETAVPILDAALAVKAALDDAFAEPTESNQDKPPYDYAKLMGQLRQLSAEQANKISVGQWKYHPSKTNTKFRSVQELWKKFLPAELGRSEKKWDPSSVKTPTPYDNSKIAILTVLDPHKSEELQDSFKVEQMKKNRNKFCKAQGYKCLFVDIDEFRSHTDEVTRHNVRWAKQKAVKNLLDANPNIEWVWWLNPNAVIMDYTVDLYSYLLNPEELKKRASFGLPLWLPTGEYEVEGPKEYIDLKTLTLPEVKVRTVDNTEVFTKPEEIAMIATYGERGLDDSSIFFHRSETANFFLSIWDFGMLNDMFAGPHMTTDMLNNFYSHHYLIHDRTVVVPRRIIAGVTQVTDKLMFKSLQYDATVSELSDEELQAMRNTAQEVLQYKEGDFVAELRCDDYNSAPCRDQMRHLYKLAGV